MKQIEKLELLSRSYKDVVVTGTDGLRLSGIDLTIDKSDFEQLIDEYVNNPTYHMKGLNGFSTRNTIYLVVFGLNFKIERKYSS